MSSITVADLLEEPNVTQEDYDKWAIVSSTEIVPRKMIEMIIEKCIRDESEPAYSDATQEEAADIRKYAEWLLKQFEEPEPTAEYDPLPFD